MRVEVENVSSLIAEATDVERGWLRDFLTFEDSRKRYACGDGRVRLLNLVTHRFPSGLVPLVAAQARKAGFQISVLDLRQEPEADNGVHAHGAQTSVAWLRDYQVAAYYAATSFKRGIIWAPTGSGKTEIFCALAQAISCRWLLLVHRAQLVKQAAERFELRTGERAGRVAEGVWDAARVTCATFQTLARALGTDRATGLLQGAGGLVVDECHTLPAESFTRVAMAAKNAYWRIGLSGTPLARGDRRSVMAIGALGPVIHRIRTEALVASGVLAKPRIRMVPCEQQSSRPTWQGVYGECVVRSKKRNAAVARAVSSARKPCLVFVKEISHGRALLKLLQDRDVRADFVWGSDSVDRRASAVKNLVRGELDALVCSVIFQEGLDVPELRSVVVGSGGRSIIATLQRIGRGMRATADKMDFEVWDIADRGNKLLERHARARARAYESEGHSVEATS